MANTETGDLRRLIATLGDELTAAGIEDGLMEAELIAAHVLSVSRGRAQSLAVMGTAVSDEDQERMRHLVAQRASRVPLQHLTGRAPFRTIELAVGPGVFVPRPETETVAQIALDALAAVPSPTPIALDLCTGSGALALALVNELPTVEVWAIEKSPSAHAWAERNVAELGDGRVTLLFGDVADAPTLLPERIRGRIDVLVTNPPYVPIGMVPRDPEVRDHDPELALFGGDDGLDVIRTISRIGTELVAPGGTLVCEHAEGQGEAARQILLADGWRAAVTHRDLTHRDRATSALRSPKGNEK